LQLLQLLLRDHAQFGPEQQNLVLVGFFLSELLLCVCVFELVLLGVSLSLLDSFASLLCLEVLLHLDTALLHVVALAKLGVPKLPHCAQLLVLHVGQVAGHFVQIKGSLGLVAVGHELFAFLLFGVGLDHLESEVGNRARREVNCQGRFV